MYWNGTPYPDFTATTWLIETWDVLKLAINRPPYYVCVD